MNTTNYGGFWPKMPILRKFPKEYFPLQKSRICQISHDLDYNYLNFSNEFDHISFKIK